MTKWYEITDWKDGCPDKINIEYFEVDGVDVNGEGIFDMHPEVTYCGLDCESFEQMIRDFIESHHIEQNLFDPDDINVDLYNRNNYPY